MVGNSALVTTASARTSAPSVLQPEVSVAPVDSVAPGKDLSPAGQNLPPARQAVSAADLKLALQKLSEAMAARQRNLTFRIDEQSGRTVITVLDAATQAIVRQIPSEEVLAVSRAFDAPGTLLDAHI